jgi:nucleoside-diphosphate-sugar epimerase
MIHRNNISQRTLPENMTDSQPDPEFHEDTYQSGAAEAAAAAATATAILKGPVLVIGGAGWVGSFLTKHLSALMMKDPTAVVHVADIDSPRPELAHMHARPNVRHHPVDVSSYSSVDRIMTEIQPVSVFHLASVIDLRICPSPTLHSVNVIGTKNVVKALSLLEKTVTRYLIYTSTIDVAAGARGAIMAKESDGYSVTPQSQYEATKIAAEKCVLEANNYSVVDTGVTGSQNNLVCLALRPGHIFGEYDPIIPTIRAVPPVYVGAEWTRMSMVYVENAAIAHIHALYLLQQQVLRHHKCLEQTGPRGRNSGRIFRAGDEDISGKAYFITDFDANFCDFYFTFVGKRVLFRAWRIPAWVVAALIFVCNWIQFVSVKIFSVNYFHPVTGISNGTAMPCYHLTACPKLAHERLHYRDNSSASTEHCGLISDLFWEHRGMPTLIAKHETIKRTTAWVQR